MSRSILVRKLSTFSNNLILAPMYTKLIKIDIYNNIFIVHNVKLLSRNIMFNNLQKKKRFAFEKRS